MDNPTATASVEIQADPDLVYDIVSDVTGVPDWAAETERCRWIGGATGAAVGAKFRGRNRYRTIPWWTTSKVTAADRGRRFAFQVYLGLVPTAQWEYAIEPIEGGCRVTESTKRQVPKAVSGPANRLLGVKDRDEHNQRNIEATLAALKQFAEGRARADAP